MPADASGKHGWSAESVGPWYRWRGYTARWLLFGLAVSIFQPVANEVAEIWPQKFSQILMGLLFGSVCAVVFTRCENKFNTPRVNWKSWLIVVATWLLVKIAFVSMLSLAGD